MDWEYGMGWDIDLIVQKRNSVASLKKSTSWYNGESEDVQLSTGVLCLAVCSSTLALIRSSRTHPSTVQCSVTPCLCDSLLTPSWHLADAWCMDTSTTTQSSAVWHHQGVQVPQWGLTPPSNSGFHQIQPESTIIIMSNPSLLKKDPREWNLKVLIKRRRENEKNEKSAAVRLLHLGPATDVVNHPSACSISTSSDLE